MESIGLALAFALTVLVVAYLVYVMVKPERF
jgi:hypothetical protein